MSVKPLFVAQHKVDKFVDSNISKGKEWSWDGWTLNIFTAHPKARTSVKGSFRNGKWGFVTSIAPTTKGFWVIPRKYLEPTA